MGKRSKGWWTGFWITVGIIGVGGVALVILVLMDAFG
jgi:hypothetical protein